MCLITRFAVIPRGCKKPDSKHVILMTDIDPCPQRLAEGKSTCASMERETAIAKDKVTICPLAKCTVVDSFSARTLMLKFCAAPRDYCPVCTGQMTQACALSGIHDAMPAHYAALPDGRVLKDAGLPDLVNPPYLEPRREFAFYSRYYKNVFNPSGFWPIWNRCCMIRHLQKERRVTYREHLELQLILNQIQKYKKLGGGKLKAWNQELLPEIPDVEFFEEDAEGNLRLRSQRRSRGLKKE